MVTTSGDASMSSPRETAPVLLVEGRIIAGRYRLHHLLGKGAQGEVYRATQIDLDRPVALKLLREGVGEEARERFLHEARVTAEVRHPGVAVIYDVGLTGEGLPYYTMELLEGESLAARIDRELRIPAADIVPIIAGVCAALDAVHAKKLIHRDVKPSNVFLARRGDGGIDPKLIDFGIAKSTAVDAPEVVRKITLKGIGGKRSPIKTLPGIVAGTPVYLSPEQISGRSADARSDLYALAVTLYEALTGTPPFDVPDTSELLVRIFCEEPEPPDQRAPQAEIPPSLSRVVVRGLAKDPADRYASASELANALWTALVEAREGRVAEAPASPERRRRVAVLIGLALAALLLVVVLRLATRRPAPVVATPSAPSIVVAAPPALSAAPPATEPSGAASAALPGSSAPVSERASTPSARARASNAPSASSASSAPTVSIPPPPPPPPSSAGFRIDDLKTPF